MLIPDYIAKNSNLSINAKFLYALILEHQNNGVCIEDNTFFACCFGKGVSERTIRNYLKELKDNSLIFVGKFKQAKNAIFVLNSTDYVQNEPQKIGDLSEKLKNVQLLEKFFQNTEKECKNTALCTTNTDYTKGLCNKALVLVSNKNKNNNILLNTRAREEIDNPTIFSNYERLKESERAFEHAGRAYVFAERGRR